MRRGLRIAIGLPSGPAQAPSATEGEEWANVLLLACCIQEENEGEAPYQLGSGYSAATVEIFYRGVRVASHRRAAWFRMKRLLRRWDLRSQRPVVAQFGEV
jgi:hypothetical protein